MVGLSPAAGTLVHSRTDICWARTPHPDTGFRGVPSREASLRERFLGNAPVKKIVSNRNDSVFGAAEALSATNSWMV
jgi:hypothetical protein